MLCVIKDCENKVLAKGLCNAHYTRMRFGKDLNPPIKKRGIRFCTEKECNKKHEGLGLCKSHLRKLRRKERWELLIEKMGGCCQECKKEYHFSCYDFHHLDPSKKEYSIGSVLMNYKIEDIEKEVDKCILLCSNCHRIIHYKIKNNGKL